MRLVLLIALACLVTVARGDQEASNRSHVSTSDRGTLYAKSFPEESYGPKGTTEVYQVVEGDGPDRLLHRYDWFSNNLRLYDELGGTLVRFGAWDRGHEASADHLAIAFYRAGRLLRSYSTLEIAGTPGDVSRSVSHYQVFGRVLGVRETAPGTFVFEAEFHTGRVLGFDLRTGARVPELASAHADEAEFNDLRRAVQAAGLPVAKAIEAYEVRAAIARESVRIGDDLDMPLATRRQALVDLVRRARARFVEVLGPVVGPAYANGPAKDWLRELEEGSTVQFQGNTRIVLELFDAAIFRPAGPARP